MNAAKQAMPATPIVFAIANDPVSAGLVASLARPGGNVTGLANLLPIRWASGSNCCARLFLHCAGWVYDQCRIP